MIIQISPLPKTPFPGLPNYGAMDGHQLSVLSESASVAEKLDQGYAQASMAT